MTERDAEGHFGFRLLSTLYADEVMCSFWSESSTIETWLRVEAALAVAQGEVGLLTPDEAAQIAAACRMENIDRAALWESTRNVGYPIFPLVRDIAATLPDGPNGRVHYGATTQDIMDTALAIQLRASCNRLIELLHSLGDALADMTTAHAGRLMAARTHAQQAVPTTFGAKMAVFLGEVTRHLDAVRQAGTDVSVVSLFGAGGTNAAMGSRAEQVRAHLADKFGLRNTNTPWHVARDRIARFGTTCATLSATCIRLAREIINLSRTEIGEVREPRLHHRGASSTMPQKANPIYAEAVIGFGISAESAASSLWRAMEAGHERAAGEWQIEWIAVPQVAECTASCVRLTAELTRALEIIPAAMERNLNLDPGLLMSEGLMMRLAERIGRERAHDLLYRAAHTAMRTGQPFADAYRSELGSELTASTTDLGADPMDYIGEALDVCTSTVEEWKRCRGNEASGTSSTEVES